MSDIRPLFYGMKGQIRGWSMESLHLLQYLLENERPEGAFDYHTGPVNTVGIPLLETFSEDAAALFSEAARITEEYRDKHGCVRHSGAYWANWASAKAKSGHYDHALHGYLVGADEDLQHWKTPVEESFGLNVIWKEWSQRVIEASLDLIREIDSTVTLEDYRKELARVPDADAVIVRYLFTFFDNRRLQQRRDSLLVKLGVEDAIRNMGVAYEWYLKSVLTDKTKTLHPTLKDHFETRTWWTNFETERVNAKNNADPIGYALGLSTTGDITNEFWKSLIILYLVRNMFSHTMEGKFADPNSDRPEQVLGRVLHTVIKTHMFSSQTFP